MAEEVPFEISQRDPAEPADAPHEPEERERAEEDSGDAQWVGRGDELPRGAAVREEALQRDTEAFEAQAKSAPKEEGTALPAHRDDAAELAKERTGPDAAPVPIAGGTASPGKEARPAHNSDIGTLSPKATGALVQDQQTKNDASATEMPSRIRKADNREPWGQEYRRLVKGAIETRSAPAGGGSAAGPREPEIAAAKLDARSGAGETARNAALPSGQAGHPAEAALRELLASVNQNHREAMEYRSHQI